MPHVHTITETSGQAMPHVHTIHTHLLPVPHHSCCIPREGSLFPGSPGNRGPREVISFIPHRGPRESSWCVVVRFVSSWRVVVWFVHLFFATSAWLRIVDMRTTAHPEGDIPAAAVFSNDSFPPTGSSSGVCSKPHVPHGSLQEWWPLART